MQYKGFKRIRRVAAVILSAALLVTEAPQSGVAYAVEETAQSQETQTDTDSGSGTTGTEAKDAESGEAEETQPKPETEGSTETGKKPETEESTETGKKPETEESTETGKKPETEGSTETGPKPETEESTQTESETEESTKTEPETETSTETEISTETETETTETETEEETEVPVPVVDTRVYEYAEYEVDSVYEVDTALLMNAQTGETFTLQEESGAYAIKNRDDFIDFMKSSADYKGKTVKLECDIDMGGEAAGYAGSFAGTFDGQWHSIVNFKVEAGLFRTVESGALVKNLHIGGASFGGSADAGVIAFENRGTIEYCVVSSSLAVKPAMNAAGGIVAVNDGTIKNCAFSGDITASGGMRVAGIAGINRGKIEGSHAAGTISGTACVVSGISSVNEGTITDSYNYMDISGKNSVAGVTAENAGYIKNCRNYGNIDLTSADNGGQAGGICAKNTRQVQGSYNYGNVSSAVNNAGGIAGYTTGEINGCGNFGEISGKANVAGVAGLYKGTETNNISGCFNKGTVTGNGSGAGGILGSAGENNPVNIKECWNKGNVNNSSSSAEAFKGSIAGVIAEGSIGNCYGGVGDIAGSPGKNVVGTNYSDMSKFTETPPEYKTLVVYELNGGCSAKYFELVAENITLTKPADPKKTQGTFVGWYSDSGLGSQFNFDSAISGKSVVIYAKWTGSVSVTSFAFKNAGATIPKGTTYKIEVVYTPQDAENKTLTWSSSDERVATVIADAGGGKVTAVGPGVAEITAMLADGSLNIVGKFKVTVTENTNEIWIRDADSAGDNPGYGKDIKELGVTLNKPYMVEAIVSGNIPASATIVWASSDESVVEVKPEGKAVQKMSAAITGKKKGTAFVTATFFSDSSDPSALTKEAVLEVSVGPLSESIDIMLGDKAVTEETLIYDYGTSMFVAAGSGKGNKLPTPVAGLDAKVYPSAARPKLEWVSSDSSVIIFPDKNSGNMQARSNGRAKVTVKALDTEKTAEVTVEVKVVASKIKIEPYELSGGMSEILYENGRVVISGGQSVKLNINPEPVDAGKNVRWEFSGNGKTIKVAAAGTGVWKATAQPVTQETEVTLTATSLDFGPTGDGAKGEIKFIVKPKVKKVNIYRAGYESNTVNGGNIGANPEDSDPTVRLKAKNDPENASQAVIWKSSDESVAVIEADSDGTCTVKAQKKVGKATITATAADGSGIKATTTINVAVTATNITISGSSTVMRGKTIQLTAKVEPASVSNSKVIWQSRNPSVAKVDSATGKVTGVGDGSATITAISADGSGVYTYHTVIVTRAITKFNIIDGRNLGKTEPKNAEPLNNRSIGIDPDASAEQDRKWQLDVYVEPETACRTVTWKSSNEKVATVDAGGIVTAKGIGSATITAISGDGSGKSAKLTVNVNTLVEGITLTGPNYIGIGKTIQLKAEVKNKDAANKKVLWSSSDTGVVKVDSNGKISVVKGKTSGTVTITAEAADGGGISANHTVHVMTVWDNVNIAEDSGETYKIKIEKSKKFIDVPMDNQETVTISLNAELTGGTNVSGTSKEILWSSSKKKVAEIVSSTGVTAKVKVYEKGNAVITAKTTDGYAKTDTCTIRVTNNSPVVNITGPTQVAVGKTIQLSTGRTAIDKWTVSWDSNTAGNKKSATVNSRGQVTGKMAGTVKIKAEAKVGSASKEYTVTVAAPVGSVAIKLDDESKTDVTGKKLGIDIDASKQQLFAFIDGSKVENDAPVGVVWKSNKTSVAKVDEDGTVEPVKPGTATITATATDGSGKKATVTVIVAQQVEKIEALNAVSVVGEENVYETRIAKGKSVQLKVDYRPLAATTKKVTWAVATEEDEKYVSVNSGNGTVKAKEFITGEGKQYATVVATASDSGGVTCTFRIYVTEPTDKVIVKKGDKEYLANSLIGIDIDADKAGVQLGTIIKDKQGNLLTNQSVAWKSGNAKIATVDDKGLVKGVKTGQTNVTATVLDGSGKSCTVKIYVGKLVTGIDHNSSPVTVVNGETVDLVKQLNILARPVTATSPKLTFKSLDTSVVTVDGKGVVRGRKKGSTTTVEITTTDGTNITKTITVTVN